MTQPFSRRTTGATDGSETVNEGRISIIRETLPSESQLSLNAVGLSRAPGYVVASGDYVSGKY